jgi:muramidase (phage lysozyme)
MSNRDAFLTMLAASEGTKGKCNDDGYSCIVGGSCAGSYDDHPRILVDLGHGLKSTAAGRYQVLERYFDAYKAQLGLPDFSPASQDAIALQQIKERNALDDIDAGNLASAVTKCSNIWASLPGNNYGQHVQTIAFLTAAYTDAGGTLADA